MQIGQLGRKQVFAALMSGRADKLSYLSMWNCDIVLVCFFQLTFCIG